MTPAVRWILVIVGLLAGNLIAMAILIVSAKTSGAQVIPAYYERAVAFDGEIDDATRSRSLGWQIDVTFDRATIAIEARDAGGAPIAGARVRARGFQRAYAAGRFDVELRAVAPGRYRIGRESAAGIHDLEIVLELRDARFVARRVVEVR